MLRKAGQTIANVRTLFESFYERARTRDGNSEAEQMIDEDFIMIKIQN